MSQLQDGLDVRRDVLGDEYVDTTYQQPGHEPGGFMEPFQELVNQFVWNGVWGRDDLPRQTRCLLTVTILAVMGRIPELKMHVGAARRNGCTDEEIRAALLQVTAYAGAPAGFAAMKAARDVLLDVDAA